MKRRDFFKAVAGGSIALALALVRCKAESEPEPKTVVKASVDRSVDGGDQGGYLVPKDIQEELTAAFVKAEEKGYSVKSSHITISLL